MKNKSMNADQKRAKEKRIFLEFCKTANLNIDEATIEQPDPPQPDILIKDNGTKHGFELTELTNQEVRAFHESRFRICQFLRNSYAELSDNHPLKAKRIFDGASITLFPKEKIAFMKIQQCIDSLWNFCSELPPSCNGDILMPDNSELNLVFSYMEIERGRKEPSIGTHNAIRDDPSFDKISEKLGKNYSGVTTIELLIYWEHPRRPNADWTKKLLGLLYEELPKSPFSSCWLFTTPGNDVSRVIFGFSRWNPKI